MKMPESANGKHGMGIHSVVFHINNEILMLPGKRKLSVSMIHHAVQRGEFGLSPKKIGRRPTLPPELMYGLVVHSIMMQLSGEGEMSSLKMRTLATTIMLGTQANPCLHLENNKA